MEGHQYFRNLNIDIDKFIKQAFKRVILTASRIVAMTPYRIGLLDSDEVMKIEMYLSYHKEWVPKWKCCQSAYFIIELKKWQSHNSSTFLATLMANLAGVKINYVVYGVYLGINFRQLKCFSFK